MFIHLHGGFLKWGYPGYPQIIHFSRIFHYKPSIWIHLGVTPLMETPLFHGKKIRFAVASPRKSNESIHDLCLRPPALRTGSATMTLCCDKGWKPKMRPLTPGAANAIKICVYIYIYICISHLCMYIYIYIYHTYMDIYPFFCILKYISI